LKEVKSLLNLRGAGSGLSYTYSTADIYMPALHHFPDPNLVKSIENYIIWLQHKNSWPFSQNW